MDLVVLGGCIHDLISYTERFPKSGETVRGDRFAVEFGGSGANAAVMGSLLGAKVAMISKVGDDVFGPDTILNFHKLGVDTTHVHTEPAASTGTATITVNRQGENCIVMTLGANDFVTSADVEAASGMISGAKMFCTQLEVPTSAILAALCCARNAGVPTLVNLVPLQADFDRRLLHLTDICCVNENEAEMLCNEQLTSVEDAKRLTNKILTMGPSVVLTTLGEKGCVFQDSTMIEAELVESPKVQAVDTTGAGDCFVASFAYLTTSLPQLSLRERVRRSCIIASRSVLLPATQASYPTRDQLESSLFTL